MSPEAKSEIRPRAYLISHLWKHCHYTECSGDTLQGVVGHVGLWHWLLRQGTDPGLPFLICKMTLYLWDVLANMPVYPKVPKLLVFVLGTL